MCEYNNGYIFGNPPPCFRPSCDTRQYNSFCANRKLNYPIYPNQPYYQDQYDINIDYGSESNANA